MKVRVIDSVSGKTKVMDEKFASILVKMKRATYETKVMEQPKVNASEPVKKKRGRKKKYETKVMESDV